MRGPHILAVDLGSSSVRSALFDGGGNLVPGSLTKMQHGIRYSVAGAGELDPDEVVLTTSSAIDEVLGWSREHGITVDAVAMDSMWHAVCGLDLSGRPAFPVLTWADRRAAAATPALHTILDDLSQHRRTGARLHSVYAPVKLRWLAQARPEWWARTEQVLLSPADLLFRRLFGTHSTSVSMASASGLLDQHRLVWDDEVLAAVPVESASLPQVSDEPHTGLAPTWRRRWPELASTPWFPCVGDGATSSIGSGCTDPSRLALMIGTTSALRMVWPTGAVHIPDDLWCYRVDAGRVVLGGALNDGGNLVGWLQRTLRLPDVDAAEQLMRDREPGAGGVILLPTFAGERGPGWSEHARGAIAGLTQATEPIDLLHAALEGVALRIGMIAAAFDETLPRQRDVVTSGRGMSSVAWRQIMADVLGIPVYATDVEEASLRGAALLALERLGAVRDYAPLAPRIVDVRHPRPERHERYRELLAEQTRLYRVVSEDTNAR